MKLWKQTCFGRAVVLMLCLWMTIGGLLAALAPSAFAASSRSLKVTMEDVGDPNGYTLKTVRTYRSYPFTRPRGWKVLPSSRVHVEFQHSTALQPERSSLNVLVNNRILKTIRLDDDNAEPTSVDIAIPPELLKDHNTLTYQVDQHYTYNCEDPFSTELWTTVLPESYLELDYAPMPVNADLADVPYPLIDTLNNYMPARIGYLVPESMSDGSLTAFAVASVFFGQQSGWRDMKPYLADRADLREPENLVLIGTPSENPAIGAISRALDVKLSGGQFIGPDGAVLAGETGVLQLVRNPYNPAYVILVISGNGSEGVAKAAYALAQEPANKLLVGESAIIRVLEPGEVHPYRAWDGFVQYSGDTFHDLGLSTMTARGITALPLFYQVNVMPDLFMAGQKKVKLKTVFSYSSQLSNDNSIPSRLEIMLNGKSIDDIPLLEQGGDTLVTHDTWIPVEEFHNYNEIAYQFHLYPEKYEKCRFVTDAHLWGTIHSTSSIELPAELKTPLPDVGLINDGGFPFTGYQDLSRVSVVMPDNPSPSELNVMLQSLTRLGRVSQSKRGIRLTAYHAGSVAEEAKKENHLILIGTKDSNTMLAEFDGRFHLLMEGNTANLRGINEKLAEFQYTPDQGVMEEVISPWNASRVALALTGETGQALKRIANLFASDKLFGGIGDGNISVVNENSSNTFIVMKQGDARFMYPSDLRQGFNLPTWGWILAGFFALVGLFSVARFLFGR